VAFSDLLGPERVRRISVSEASKVGGPARLTAGAKGRFALRALTGVVRWRPDLIVCVHLGLAPLGWLAGTLRRRPYWVVLHGIEAWGPLAYRARAALRHANLVVTTSAFSHAHVMALHRLSAAHTRRLPCVLESRLLKLRPAEDSLQRRLGGRPRLVLTVARLAASEQYKGHDVVLQALPRVLAQVPDLTYLIVGDGDDRPRLEGMARQLGVRDRVVFAGEVSDEELAACYRASEVFVLPARTRLGDHPKGEGFGIVFLEAMAFGKPVIGPDYGAPAEIIRHSEHGLLVNPEDPEAVAAALLQLLTAPAAARSMGEAASEWVKREYSYESFRRRLERLLQEYAL
jgi:phosphatidyl-myo-inositol dimannoside synthase